MAGDVSNIYQGGKGGVPSQQAIYQKMLTDNNSFATTLIQRSKVAQFLDEALKIQDSQLKLLHVVGATNEHDLLLQKRLDDWRKIQNKLMPSVGDKVAAQALSAPAAQCKKLFLPSNIATAGERQVPLGARSGYSQDIC
ncbi:hypothetical protein C8R43DRAFT_958063 [Mycena crocata]|nr:hypothetical protein C8R43DRAFT_958063 [Mycena crocata]